jgi:hypothetical protein
MSKSGARVYGLGFRSFMTRSLGLAQLAACGTGHPSERAFDERDDIVAGNETSSSFLCSREDRDTTPSDP